MMGAGRRDRWIVFQVFAGADDGAGGHTDVWADLTVPIPAAIAPMMPRQSLEAGLLVTERGARIECAWRADVATERRELRAVLQDPAPVTYAIRAVRDVEGRRRWLECDAVEVSV